MGRRRRASLSVDAPPSVTIELVRQRTSGTWVLHLVNFKSASRPRYRGQRKAACRLCARQPVLDSPDGGGPQTLQFRGAQDAVSFRIPQLEIYGLVLMKMRKSAT
jgi:hypothetical protein